MERPRLAPKDAPPDQWWFWTDEWQAGEREADADIAAGRTTFYASTEDFIASLSDSGVLSPTQPEEPARDGRVSGSPTPTED